MKNLHNMLTLQDRMNCKVNPEWLTAGYDYLRAAAIEAGEALESLGWKWWKAQKPDTANVKIELVDIWHFILSEAIRSCGSIARAEDFLTSDDCNEDAVPCPYPYSKFHPLYELDNMTAQECMELLMGLSAMRAPLNQIVSVFNHLRLQEVYGITMYDDELYTAYLSKNVLNFFRQDHGYKAGTYHKNWSLVIGEVEEDNVVMTRYATELQASDSLTESTLYDALAAHYVRLCAFLLESQAAEAAKDVEDNTDHDAEYARRLKGDDAASDNTYALPA